MFANRSITHFRDVKSSSFSREKSISCFFLELWILPVRFVSDNKSSSRLRVDTRLNAIQDGLYYLIPSFDSAIWPFPLQVNKWLEFNVLRWCWDIIWIATCGFGSIVIRIWYYNVRKRATKLRRLDCSNGWLHFLIEANGGTIDMRLH